MPRSSKEFSEYWTRALVRRLLHVLSERSSEAPVVTSDRSALQMQGRPDYVCLFVRVTGWVPNAYIGPKELRQRYSVIGERSALNAYPVFFRPAWYCALGRRQSTWG
jgi:hypothetical protein